MDKRVARMRARGRPNDQVAKGESDLAPGRLIAGERRALGQLSAEAANRRSGRAPEMPKQRRPRTDESTKLGLLSGAPRTSGG